MQAIRAIACLALVAGCSASFMFPHVVKSGTEDPSGCCMKGTSWQYMSQVNHASSDTSDPNENSFRLIFTQVDALNQRVYQNLQINPVNRLVPWSLDIWVAPGGGPEYFTQYWRSSNGGVCYFQTVRDQGWFDLPCWQPPSATFFGQAVFGANLKTQVWREATAMQNVTTAVDPTPLCMPVATWYTAATEHFLLQDLANVMDGKFTVDDPSHFTPPTDCRPAPPPTEASVIPALKVAAQHVGPFASRK